MSKTVVITRPGGGSGGARDLADKVESLGLCPFTLPVLRCEPMQLSAADEALVRNFVAAGEGWVAFLSPSAVHMFRQLCDQRFSELGFPASIKFAVQGRGTADALQRCFGRRADFVPTVFVAEEFGEEFARGVGQQGRVLVPQSADGRDVLAPLLRSKGLEVVSVATYRTREVVPPLETIEAFQHLDPNQSVVVFMSPSSVRATVTALASQRAVLDAMPAISVGPITTQAVKAAGLHLAYEATAHSEEGVIEALRAHFQL